MARKKNIKGRRGGGDDDDDDSSVEADKNQKPNATTATKAPPPAHSSAPASAAPSASATTTTSRSNKRKEKQQGKQQQQQQQQQAKQKNKKHDDSDSEDEDETLAALLGGKLTTKYGISSDSDDDDDSEEDRVKPGKKGVAASAPTSSSSKSKSAKKKQGRSVILKQQQKMAAAPQREFPSSEQEDEDDLEEVEELMEDDDDDDDGEVQQVAFKLADDDDWGTSSKKKKDKKEKKEKKHKKEKKKKKEKKEETNNKDEEDDDDNDGDESSGQAHPKEIDKEPELLPPEPEPVKQAKATATSAAVQPVIAAVKDEPKKKTKLELQIEAALQKKNAAVEDEKAKKLQQTQNTKPKQPEPEPDWVDTTKKKSTPAANPNSNTSAGAVDKPDHEHDIVYGAPDDVVWSDKSHAQRLAEAQGSEDEDESAHMYGPDGKKLSNKERKKLQKAKQAAEREAAFQTAAAQASKEGAQFACSQTAVNENDPQWENSLDINVPSFSISAAGKILFKDASLSIAHGRRYGLVGPNGRGKSTLLKMITSRDLKLPPRIDFLYVEQEVVADDTPAVEAVLKADKRRWDLQLEEKKLMQAVDTGDESEETILRLQEVVDELVQMDADSAESKARRILYGLGFTMEMQTKPTKMFSGGWRMRISLARALFIEPTLLMLDEPTNHLDLNAVIWLDEYLQRWKKTLLIVSHDQDFLNSVCQEILHIEDLKLISYKGNYDDFKKAEKTKFVQQVKAWEKQEKRLRELKKSGQSKAKAQETVMKSATMREAGARAQKKKNQAIAAGTETADNQELIKRPREYHVKLEFADVAELSRPVIEVGNVHFRYSPKHPIIFDKIDFGIDMDSRICVVGPNGAGKTTLLKLLTGELDPTTGDVKRNPRLRMGIYNQHFVDRLPMNKTPIEHLRDRFQEEEYQSIRNRLGKYGLEGHAHEVTMRDLSGGQKARVVFVELSLQRPHILLLDEPTNNLDIETIDALCDAINNFNGGIVVVTHDQRLVEVCECTLWVVEKQGVTKWEKGFDDYKSTILRELEEHVAREAAMRQEKLDAAATVRAEKLARLATKVKAQRK